MQIRQDCGFYVALYEFKRLLCFVLLQKCLDKIFPTDRSFLPWYFQASRRGHDSNDDENY